MTEKAIHRTLLGAFCISGASALIYEVVWTRALSLLLGSTVYALSTMLSTFMAGLALGSYIGGKIADRQKDLLFAFGLLEVGVGLCGLLTVPVIYSLPPLYFGLYKALHLNGAAYFLAQFLLCAGIMILPTTLMGATFPVVSRRLTETLAEMGRKVGDAYSLNTAGAIFGSLAAGFLLIPLLGIRNASYVAVFLNVATGMAVLLLSRHEMRRKAILAALILSVPASLPAMTVSTHAPVGTFYYAGRFETYDRVREFEGNQVVVYEKDHTEGSLRAFYQQGFMTIQHGGKMEGTAPLDVANTLMLATLPAAAYGAKPEEMLVIGLGAGVTTWFSKQVSPHVDVVEINPGVVRVVSEFGFPGTLDRVGLFINDARQHLLLHEKKYDIITSEPSVPSEAMSANLYTREFYELVAARLKKGGVFCQWMPAWAMTKRDTHIAAKTFGSVFPSSLLWVVLQTNDFIMIGAQEPLVADADEIFRRASAMRVSLPDHLSKVLTEEEMRRSYGKVRLIRNPAGMRELQERRDLPLMTDDRPYLEFAITKNLLLGPDYRQYRE